MRHQLNGAPHGAMQRMTQPKAIDAYLSAIGQIQQELDKLQERLNNHFDADPDHINWADVGSVNHILERLKELN